ncbi:sensor histidine kinase [Ohessyouella blattaphilus]|uniref:Sensor histidine kinase n=1 Tax=Ohessyouella blattaphilus TaxID=2949333 RepID=A0ABT1EKT2_9FIRM|nr:sensor histidine kinase [Ohessyouella blattaphilus]MCP1111315.1 sensor histidine kinase [Ohessyouella blattaphilus]MCR8564709.1 sensor histidine kinase [Ohessyouella blattaphilus]
MGKKLSLNKRIGLIALSALLPMALLLSYLLFVLSSSVQSFNEVTKSISYASAYAETAKDKIDYTMYYAIYAGREFDKLEVGRTFGTVEIVDPYEFIEELRGACYEMSDLATISTNQKRAERMIKTLDSLEKRVSIIDENLQIGGKFEDNKRILNDDIESLTDIINETLQDYIYLESESLANVRDDVVRQEQNAITVCVITVAIVLVASISLSVFAIRSVTTPIKKLSKMAGKVAKGDFTARTEVPAEDEIAVLTNSFNDMTQEIGDLIENIKAEQANLRLTESKLLQAQINPHFLYNTLDTIVWMAEEKKSEQVVKVVTLLSQFFRTTLSGGSDYISINEELKHVESYLKIQEVRYQDILDFEIEASPEVLEYRIPKLTLQPLVENALYHGIKNKRGKGLIRVEAVKKGQNILLKIIDNGVGMTEEELQSTRNRLVNERQSGSSGYGIYNVNRRIKYYCGEEYGVFFESEKGVGTSAVVIIAADKITPIS